MTSRIKNLRIGVFGGTFDPPHIGHLIIAEQACEQLHLNRVLFVPAYVPPHKKNKATASPQQRLAMVKLALAGSTRFSVSTIEIRRGGISYTVDTLRELHGMHPGAKLFLLVGGDNYAGFRTWKSIGEIVRLASIVVYRRNSEKEHASRPLLKRVKCLKGAYLDVSSTLIREKVKRGESIRYLLPEKVERYIRHNGMYRRRKK